MNIRFAEPISYLKVIFVGLAIFGLLYAYTSYAKTPNVLNKSLADASIILIALSMWMSSLSYFFNFADKKLIYRKYLGLVGFAFGILHITQVLPAFTSLFTAQAWQHGIPWAFLTGLFAIILLTIMALVSNRFSMTKLGIQTWRTILRMGYLVLILIWLHILLLKSPRWITWINGGMKTLPSTSFLIAIFITVVVSMRITMWLRIRANASQK